MFLIRFERMFLNLNKTLMQESQHPLSQVTTQSECINIELVFTFTFTLLSSLFISLFDLHTAIQS